MSNKPQPKIKNRSKKRSPEEIAEERIAKWKPHRGKATSKVRDYTEAFGATTQILDLNNLGLKTVPMSVRALKDLELLAISGNKISELPHWIGELSKLRALGLAHNMIKRLPAEIGSLRVLSHLFLQENQLHALPKVLRGLRLKSLYLDGNPELDLPISILQRPAKEILTYYFESRGKKGRPLLELRLLLVGRGKAGKTTLMKQLAGEKPDKHELETHSIAIRELMLNCTRGQVRARAWDFGGQEILHATHQFFLTERSLYLLVLEPRSGLAQRDAEYWLKLIQTQGGGSPVIVAMNWSHERPWQIDEVKLRRKFPFIVGFLATDAWHGDGIEKLRRKINQTVEKRMPDVLASFSEALANYQGLS